jgi:flagellar biosynthesis protein FlhB
MLEERTQAPSKRRWQMAKERGQVARSPELTAAVGLLALALAMGTWGGSLADALAGLVRKPLAGASMVGADAFDVVSEVRGQALAAALPLGGTIAVVCVAMLLAHQLQVGGLWAPGLLAPDATRLWTGPAQLGLGGRLARGLWALARALVLAGVAIWAINARLPMFQRLGQMEARGVARASAAALYETTCVLALAMLGLGAADYLFQYRRLALRLQQTPEEFREDQRASDGDPALRSQRRRLAQARQREPVDALEGATLVLVGKLGLTIALAGGPPPRRVSIRLVSKGPAGFRLRMLAGRSGVPRVNEPDLAAQLARYRAARQPVPQAVLDALAAAWPQPGAFEALDRRRDLI